MPRMGRGVPQKSKDFKGSMIRIIKNLNPWKYFMILGLMLAMTSAILSLIAPDRLSDFSNEIVKGIKPNEEKLEILTKEMFNRFQDEEYMKSKMIEINMSTSISKEDKEAFMKSLASEDKSAIMSNVPDDILNVLFEEISVDGVKITSEDQVKVMHIMAEINAINGKDLDSKEKSKELFKQMDKLPESVISLIKPKLDMEAIKKIATIMAVIYVCSALFSYIQALSMTYVSNYFAKSLRTRISKKINKLPLKYFDTHETGDVLSRVTNDVDMIGHNLNQSLASLVSNTTLFIGSIFMMFYTNWIMAITAILSSIIGFIFMFILLGKSQKYFIKRQEDLGAMNGYIEEIYSGHIVVKAYNGTKESRERFKELNHNLYNANRKSQFLSGMMQPIMGFVGNLGYVCVCVVGALLTMNNIIEFGVIVAFMIYVRLFTNPLSQIAQAMTSLQSTAAASERVFEFLDEKEMSDESSLKGNLELSDAKGNIIFDHVKFGYDEDKTIINDFTAKVSHGEKIAIVGPTGAGKTTMVNLLMKFYEINSGNIIIDGVNTKDMTRENIHDLFVMVLQDTWLFEGNIRDNLKFNREDITDEEIWKVCKTVGIDHFIKTLPGGLDAEVNDNDSISGGQKQLLTIARGMLQNSPFLILDEATSNVDTRTEELVQKAMDKLAVGKTSFIIAHRLSTIKNADLILVMRDGNIVEQGNHEELLNQNGFYASLYNSQFEK